MKKIFLIVIPLLLVSCGGHSVVFSDTFCSSLNNSQEEAILKQYSAKEDIFSLIHFTSRFDNDSLSIKNADLVLNEKINTSTALGLAKVIRVKNNTDIVIRFLDYDMKLSEKNLKKYKYIYIRKDIFKNGNPYIVTFSNTLCGFR